MMEERTPDANMDAFVTYSDGRNDCFEALQGAPTEPLKPRMGVTEG